MLAVAPVASDVGALTETVMAGGVLELLPPQAVRKRVNAVIVARRMLWGRFIAHLRTGSGDAGSEVQLCWVCGSKIRGGFELQSSDRRGEAAGRVDSFGH